VAPNRKSLRTQIDEVMSQMTELAKEEKPATARVSLLTTQLETLRYLHQQETAAENEKLKKRIAELESPSATTQPQTTSPSNDALLDAQVAAMLERHNAGMAENKSTLQLPVRVPTLTRDEPVTSLPAPVEDDPDLVT
jgi:peptidoglycan hydrolase CwlO-like protein